MVILNSEVASSCSPLNSSSITQARSEFPDTICYWSPTPDQAEATCTLDTRERLAAYLVHEPHVEPIMRLLLEMSEDQRRMSLMMMQCIALEGDTALSSVG